MKPRPTGNHAMRILCLIIALALFAALPAAGMATHPPSGAPQTPHPHPEIITDRKITCADGTQRAPWSPCAATNTLGAKLALSSSSGRQGTPIVVKLFIQNKTSAPAASVRACIQMPAAPDDSAKAPAPVCKAAKRLAAGQGMVVVSQFVAPMEADAGRLNIRAFAHVNGNFAERRNATFTILPTVLY